MQLQRVRSSLLLVALCGFLLVGGVAQAADTGYQVPPEPLASIVDQPLTPLVNADPTGQWLLLIERPSLPGIGELAEPELRLAGIRFKPQTFGPSRSRPFSGLRLMKVADGQEKRIAGIPEGARIGNLNWSADGGKIAFTITGESGIELWVADVATARAKRLTGPILNLVSRQAPRFLDGDSVVALVRPEGQGAEPEPSRVPGGPVIQENLGEVAPARTYQDLLADAHDEALFEHYMRSQVARISLDGSIERLGAPGLYFDLEPAPGGEYLLVGQYRKPFSYLVPASRFPRRVEVWNRAGQTVRQVADLPLQEGVPIAFGSVPTGPRSIQWRDDKAAELLWVEALDGGDAGKPADERDRAVLLSSPFDGEPKTLAKTALRFGGVVWGNDDMALLYEWWWRTRQNRIWRLKPGQSDAEPALVADFSFEDRYANPGSPVTEANGYGRDVLKVGADGNSIFLIGEGASPEGDRPFLDRHSFATGEAERLFRSEAPYYERPSVLLSDDGSRFLTLRESVEEQPNYYVRDLKSGDLRQLTRFPHPSPQLQGFSKELIRYERADGVQLTATLYLPPGYEASQGPLPAVVWAYPQEFKSADAAGQVNDSPYRFDRVSYWSPLLWLARGFAVIDDPTMPIIGEGDVEPNDTYVKQLVDSAAAAIDATAERGVVDRERVAVGGHSYGAFMTANLLAHSDLFAAGIARSGAYNRTLTPFGFQAEERTLWQAGDVYFAMSPFMHAEKVNEPLLLIHGAADNNSGTFPMQSERFYNALKGLGATTRLVMLPHESHGYRARESILHMLWETDRWLQTYVKEAAGTAADAAP